jgi:hypothetical protein
MYSKTSCTNSLNACKGIRCKLGLVSTRFCDFNCDLGRHQISIGRSVGFGTRSPRKQQDRDRSNQRCREKAGSTWRHADTEIERNSKVIDGMRSHMYNDGVEVSFDDSRKSIKLQVKLVFSQHLPIYVALQSFEQFSLGIYAEAH